MLWVMAGGLFFWAYIPWAGKIITLYILVDLSLLFLTKNNDNLDDDLSLGRPLCKVALRSKMNMDFGTTDSKSLLWWVPNI